MIYVRERETCNVMTKRKNFEFKFIPIFFFMLDLIWLTFTITLSSPANQMMIKFPFHQSKRLLFTFCLSCNCKWQIMSLDFFLCFWVCLVNWPWESKPQDKAVSSQPKKSKKETQYRSVVSLRKAAIMKLKVNL